MSQVAIEHRRHSDVDLEHYFSCFEAEANARELQQNSKEAGQDEAQSHFSYVVIVFVQSHMPMYHRMLCVFVHQTYCLFNCCPSEY